MFDHSFSSLILIMACKSEYGMMEGLNVYRFQNFTHES